VSETKAALRAAILARLEEELAVILAGAESSRQEATDSENRQEGQYDMRAQMAAYLATGQTKIAAELNAALAAYRSLPVDALPAGAAAAVGALVTVDTQGKSARYFLGPLRGGLEVAVGSERVTVITPSSPLGRQLLGKRSGEPLSPGRTLARVE
jgi:transcription elongation GreA/GreB family factor